MERGQLFLRLESVFICRCVFLTIIFHLELVQARRYLNRTSSAYGIRLGQTLLLTYGMPRYLRLISSRDELLRPLLKFDVKLVSLDVRVVPLIPIYTYEATASQTN